MNYLLITLLGVMVVPPGKSDLLDEFAVGNNRFTADVYRELLKSNSGNILVCPLSVETVLALVHTGAGGQTAQQLAAGFHLPENKEKIQEIVKVLTPNLKSSKDYTLSSANKIYVKDGYTIKDQFKDISVNVFNADIQNIDFGKKEQAASEINKWVEDKTHDKIKNLINSDALSAATRSVLVNAMYFHGKWVTTFNKDLTGKGDFYINSKSTVKTDMMHQTDSFNYFESSELNAKFLELPYAGNDISMTFVLPNEKEGLGVLEERINDVFIRPNYQRLSVHAAIPKFTIESKIEFIPVLKALGVKDAFEDYADFDEILVGQKLKISDVIQKAFIEVEEEGTTAAAATYVVVAESYSFVERPPPKQFIADHPFIFYIKIKDIVFFAGRFSIPK